MEHALASRPVPAPGRPVFETAFVAGVPPVRCVKDSAGHFSGRPGHWTLAPGCAITRHASQAGMLKIDQGRVWLTFLSAKNGQPRTGDHFLDRGESLALAAGESVLFEPFGSGTSPSAQFRWEPQ